MDLHGITKHYMSQYGDDAAAAAAADDDDDDDDDGVLYL